MTTSGMRMTNGIVRLFVALGAIAIAAFLVSGVRPQEVALISLNALPVLALTGGIVWLGSRKTEPAGIRLSNGVVRLFVALGAIAVAAFIASGVALREASLILIGGIPTLALVGAIIWFANRLMANVDAEESSEEMADLTYGS